VEAAALDEGPALAGGACGFDDGWRYPDDPDDPDPPPGGFAPDDGLEAPDEPYEPDA
jgi:hypothetical protein